MRILKFGEIVSLVKSTVILFLVSVSFSAKVQAQGNLMINPKRVVFDGNARSQEINLINIGQDSARYAVSFVQYRMKTDGSFELISEPDPGQSFADRNLRVFPRTVSLAPNEAQIVKVQVSQSDKLEPGEYRSHLYFRALKDEKPLGRQAEATSSGELSVNLKAVFGITIPVIIRKGPNTTTATISQLQVEHTANQSTVVSFRINRSGNMSLYGDLTVEHIAADGKVSKAGLAKGVSVYTPLNFREMKITLEGHSGVRYRSGKLRITYTAPVQEKARELASAEILLK